ncbi:hypothetical protein M422DRAFT_269016 [Sphaerobolus stellatus SS14]|uniref:Unplaced genomic scaffold SPHSTscaffold_205, whole genome shotgun sequence n=1 Tax=Sphaerobolus stellatus (strain SS14) TaxID=990650 RepID=A0A0C9UWN9_SPHS4|nr:hypothetical protein M422DRAFT_269016 [Sphaerobolus stellatus SS14]
MHPACYCFRATVGVCNGLISLQILEDATLSSLIPFTFFTIAFLVATTYISLDVALTITKKFGPSNPPAALHSVPLFVLTSIWPAAATSIFFFMMAYVVPGLLREVRPL